MFKKWSKTPSQKCVVENDPWQILRMGCKIDFGRVWENVQNSIKTMKNS